MKVLKILLQPINCEKLPSRAFLTKFSPFLPILTAIIQVLSTVLYNMLCGVFTTTKNQVFRDFEENYRAQILKKHLKSAHFQAKNRFFGILAAITRPKLIGTQLNRSSGSKHVQEHYVEVSSVSSRKCPYKPGLKQRLYFT